MNEKGANLELDVKDFGPIAKAKVELRPLMVFAGPSNTGKSYLAVLIYALQIPSSSREALFGQAFTPMVQEQVEKASQVSQTAVS